MIIRNRTRLTLPSLRSYGALSSIGRALVCGTRGHGFEPRRAPPTNSSVYAVFQRIARIRSSRDRAARKNVTVFVTMTHPNWRYYRQVTGRMLHLPGDVYRDDRAGRIERFDDTDGWVEVDRNWWIDLIENGDPTLDIMREPRTTNGDFSDGRRQGFYPVGSVSARPW